MPDTFLRFIALKTWQQNVSGVWRYGNYPREVTGPVLWDAMSRACHAISIPCILWRIIQIHSQWVAFASTLNIRCYEHFQAFLVIYNIYYVTVHCQSLFLYICYLQRKQLPTNMAIHPAKTFSLVCMEDRYLCQYTPHGKTPETSLKPIRIVAISVSENRNSSSWPCGKQLCVCSVIHRWTFVVVDCRCSGKSLVKVSRCFVLRNTQQIIRVKQQSSDARDECRLFFDSAICDHQVN